MAKKKQTAKKAEPKKTAKKAEPEPVAMVTVMRFNVKNGNRYNYGSTILQTLRA